MEHQHLTNVRSHTDRFSTAEMSYN